MSHINKKRILYRNDKPIVGEGVVVYWMNRECRVRDNWALLYAKERADERKAPLVVVYNLVNKYLGGGSRQWDFKVKGLIDVENELQALGIPFILLLDIQRKSAHSSSTHETLNTHSFGHLTYLMENDDIYSHISTALNSLWNVQVGEIITDFSPEKHMRAWTEKVLTSSDVSVTVLDAHNIVPVHIASQKREFGAYTLRPKIHKLLKEFLEPFPAMRTHTHVLLDKNKANKEREGIKWERILEIADVSNQDNSVDTKTYNTPVNWIIPGEAHAKKALKTFTEHGLKMYHKRNDPLTDAQSNLSPYLHYGHIAPQRVALAVWEDSGVKDIEKLMDEHKNAAGVEEMKKGDLNSLFHSRSANHSAFLEELIVRRELADNFCFYTSEYDSPVCFPDWAQKNIEHTKKDIREYIYSYPQFENAKTHDALWNAAQMQLLKTGKMHGYLRMYWAKKILEWTPDVETAMKYAIKLNDTYELDGRDPNGYAGIAWSIGGVHDRAWFSRPVFGQIRYMNEKGCRNKFDVDSYIKKWLE